MGRLSSLASDKGKLSRLERWQIKTVRSTLQHGVTDRTLRWCQRNIGARWIHWATSNLHHMHYLERVPNFAPHESFILVANHRSFFDLYLITCELIRRGLTQRIVFPVRSRFFYDSPLGFAVNGAMSFFAMYPPIFREPSRAALNVAGLDELAQLLLQGGTFVGIHPEGRRNTSDNPRQLLPGQTGVGRLVQQSGVPVIPAFTNGLLASDFVAQVKGNFDGSGTAIHTVFGAPIDFGDLLTRPPSPRNYRAITDRIMTELAMLGEEEARLRDTSQSRSGSEKKSSKASQDREGSQPGVDGGPAGWRG
jgi:1-acyl-sn-glycerol-3-phosphate acyltransferase